MEWERAVEAALEGQEDATTARNLTLDGAVKCVQGRLPPPALLEKFGQLRQLSIANVGVSSLADFPRLKHLEKLILSDNRISGGLDFLVQAGLESLRDLDLSNNKIQYIEDLAPLAELKVVSLDLYECPVTRVANYRARVFGMIKSLKYLDKADAEENEVMDSEEEEDEDEEEEDDGGSGEVEGQEENGGKARLGLGPPEEEESEEEDEESDEDEDGIVKFEGTNGHNISSLGQQGMVNGGRFGGSGIDSRGDEDEDETSSDEDDDVENEDDEEAARIRHGALVAKASNFCGQVNEESSSSDDEEEEEEDVENVQVAEEEDSSSDEEDEDEEEIEEIDLEEEDEDEEEEEEIKVSSGACDEIIVHESDDEDENGEIGEDDGVEEEEVEYAEEDVEEEEEEDYGTEYLVQPIRQTENEEEASDFEPGVENGIDGDDVDSDEDDLEEDDGNVQNQGMPHKRKRDQVDETDDSDEDERPPRKR